MSTFEVAKAITFAEFHLIFSWKLTKIVIRKHLEMSTFEVAKTKKLAEFHLISRKS